MVEDQADQVVVKAAVQAKVARVVAVVVVLLHLKVVGVAGHRRGQHLKGAPAVPVRNHLFHLDIMASHHIIMENHLTQLQLITITEQLSQLQATLTQRQRPIDPTLTMATDTTQVSTIIPPSFSSMTTTTCMAITTTFITLIQLSIITQHLVLLS